ncbi:Protein CBG24985 [Caenorhabditis briggsae]|uniref:Protein CBG13597 n=1 Tax=Caenorhabditis briggsae TaxID=6238 RepID=G2J6A1_CAEBR|nr:Protein CBG13597 [Caenorhabditis briggsae]XP_002648636.1 Protein CBG24985 [Caenorhabditis briggsae]CAP21464.1 Protein CBG24985 [Caenorhabditis briggsae]CAP32371.1 Protein CBG13597 [Caenorhabditis briggsae]
MKPSVVVSFDEIGKSEEEEDVGLEIPVKPSERVNGTKEEDASEVVLDASIDLEDASEDVTRDVITFVVIASVDVFKLSVECKDILVVLASKVVFEVVVLEDVVNALRNLEVVFDAFEDVIRDVINSDKDILVVLVSGVVIKVVLLDLVGRVTVDLFVGFGVVVLVHEDTVAVLASEVVFKVVVLEVVGRVTVDVVVVIFGVVVLVRPQIPLYSQISGASH